MALRNLHMLCEIQKDNSFKKNLKHFLESIVYILYIVSKLRKSGVQRFKQCAKQSWNEEVLAIWRRLHQVENEFRITFLRCENFASPFPLVKFSQLHSSLAKCNFQIFCTVSIRFFLKIFCVITYFLLVINYKYYWDI